MKFEDLEVWKRSSRLCAELYKHFLQYAKGSCGELRTQIYIGMEIDYIKLEIGRAWIQETREISAMIVGLIKSVKLNTDN